MAIQTAPTREVKPLCKLASAATNLRLRWMYYCCLWHQFEKMGNFKSNWITKQFEACM